jgi:hypothetical protein
VVARRWSQRVLSAAFNTVQHTVHRVVHKVKGLNAIFPAVDQLSGDFFADPCFPGLIYSDTGIL